MGRPKPKQKKKSQLRVDEANTARRNIEFPAHKHAMLSDELIGKHRNDVCEDRANYSYSTLDMKNGQFRLLTIQPIQQNDWTSIIESVLEHRPFKERTYSCLSYNWGTPESTETILVNDSVISVRRNLWQFLWQARENGQLGPWWIDAVCINQDDVGERNHAVREMSKIYKLANEVVVWLGQVPLNLREYMCFGLSCLAQGYDTTFWWRDNKQANACMEWIGESNYWTRTWILPELFLASSLYLMIGCKKTAFNTVRYGYLKFKRDVTVDDRAYFVMATWSSKLHQRRVGFRLIQGSCCLYARDRYYSMTGVIPALRNLRIDYNLDSGAVLLDICEQSQPHSLRTLKSLLDSLSTDLSAFGFLCMLDCMKKKRPLPDEQDVLQDVLEQLESKNTNVKDTPCSERPWYFVLEINSIPSAEANNSTLCHPHCAQFGYSWRKSSKFDTKIINWNFGARIDNHRLLLAIEDREESVGKVKPLSEAPRSLPWWEKDQRTYELAWHNVRDKT